MSEYPTFNWETPEGKKILAEQEVFEALKNTHPENPDTAQLLLSWTEQEEATSVPNTPEGSVRFNMRRARLYAGAGYAENALENLEDAATEADGCQLDGLYEEIMDEILKLKSEKPLQN